MAISLINWPEEFPQDIDQQGFEARPGVATRITQFESGLRRKRSIGINQPFQFRIQMTFSDNQREDFERFYRNNLDNGSRFFCMNFPVLRSVTELCDVRFAGNEPIRWSPLGPFNWVMSAQVEVFPNNNSVLFETYVSR